MRDGALRRSVKAVARWHGQLNHGLWRAWRRRRGDEPFRLGGGCARCARCCEEPSIAVGRLTWFLPAWRRAFVAWHRYVNGFELVRRERAGRVLVFRCTHFDPATRLCDSYDSRPFMCRDYPRLLLWQPSPELLPGCGYYPVASNAAGLRRALDAQPMTTEQRAHLDARLHLRD